MCHKFFEDKKSGVLLGGGSKGSHKMIYVRAFTPFISSVFGTANWPNINRLEAADLPNLNE